jgi:hypothetical protein
LEAARLREQLAGMVGRGELESAISALEESSLEAALGGFDAGEADCGLAVRLPAAAHFPPAPPRPACSDSPFEPGPAACEPREASAAHLRPAGDEEAGAAARDARARLPRRPMRRGAADGDGGGCAGGAGAAAASSGGAVPRPGQQPARPELRGLRLRWRGGAGAGGRAGGGPGPAGAGGGGGGGGSGRVALGPGGRSPAPARLLRRPGDRSVGSSGRRRNPGVRGNAGSAETAAAMPAGPGTRPDNSWARAGRSRREAERRVDVSSVTLIAKQS